jgi:hypothetical protein
VRGLAGDELDGLVSLELAGADLGALEIGEDADGLALLLRDGADHADEVGLLRVGAVREVEAGDVEAGLNELAEDFRRAGGGAEGGDDLGATSTFHSDKRDDVWGGIQRCLHESLAGTFSPSRLRMVLTFEFLTNVAILNGGRLFGG